MVLYGIVWYWIAFALHHTASCCVVLRRAALCCVVLRCAALCCVVLRLVAWCCIVLRSAVLTWLDNMYIYRIACREGVLDKPVEREGRAGQSL